MTFTLTLFQKARVRSAVRSFNRAITMKERELESMGVPEYSKYLPARKTVKEIESRIESPNDFRRIVGYRNDLAHGRSSELTRVLKSYDKNALDIKPDYKGRLSTVYEQNIDKRARQALKRQRGKTRADLGKELFEGDKAYDLDEMGSLDYSTLVSDTDIREWDEGEIDSSVEDVDFNTIRQWEYEDNIAKSKQVEPHYMYEVFRDTWMNPLNHHQDMPGYQMMIDALDWLASHKADVLNKMLISGRNEMAIEWIVESGGESNPYINTPYDVRHNRAVDYVVSVARSVGYEG